MNHLRLEGGYLAKIMLLEELADLQSSIELVHDANSKSLTQLPAIKTSYYHPIFIDSEYVNLIR